VLATPGRNRLFSVHYEPAGGIASPRLAEQRRWSVLLVLQDRAQNQSRQAAQDIFHWSSWRLTGPIYARELPGHRGTGLSCGDTAFTFPPQAGAGLNSEPSGLPRVRRHAGIVHRVTITTPTSMALCTHSPPHRAAMRRDPSCGREVRSRWLRLAATRRELWRRQSICWRGRRPPPSDHMPARGLMAAQLAPQAFPDHALFRERPGARIIYERWDL
jgi:hypothetical protein